MYSKLVGIWLAISWLYCSILVIDVRYITLNRHTLYHIIDIIGSLELWVGLHITLLDEVLKLEP